MFLSESDQSITFAMDKGIYHDSNCNYGKTGFNLNYMGLCAKPSFYTVNINREKLEE